MKKTEKKTGGGEFTLSVRGEMTIYQAAEQKTALLEALDKAPRLDIDLSAVGEIDTAGLQLLMMLKNTAQARQRELRLSGHSAAVLEAFELTNLAGFFGDPIVIQA